MNKQTYVNLMIGLTFGLLSMTAFSVGGVIPASNGTAEVQCSAAKKGGIDRHLSHGSCASCLKKHSKCKMKCYAYDYHCKAEGVNNLEIAHTTQAIGQNKRRARKAALNRCHKAGLLDCHILKCEVLPELVDSYTCDKSSNDDGHVIKRHKPRPSKKNRPGNSRTVGHR